MSRTLYVIEDRDGSVRLVQASDRKYAELAAPIGASVRVCRAAEAHRLGLRGVPLEIARGTGMRTANMRRRAT